MTARLVAAPVAGHAAGHGAGDAAAAACRVRAPAARGAIALPLSFALCALFGAGAAAVGAALPSPAEAAQRDVRPDPELDPLRQRLRALDVDPRSNVHADYERLRARIALEAAAEARKRDRPHALALARLRVETAEAAVRSQQAEEAVRQLDLQRSEWLIEASRRDAARARAETERLRVQLQVQAEEMASLRQSVEAESLARQEAESTLDDVAGAEAEKLRAARAREAELKRLEAELSGGKPKPRSRR